MKYGNFVGKYDIPFTAEEKKEIGKTLSAFIDNLPYNISNLFKRDERGKLVYFCDLHINPTNQCVFLIISRVN